MVKDVLWTQPAEDDLESIFNYYKDQDSEEYAHELRIQILDTPDSLMLPNVVAEEMGQTELTLHHFNQGHRYLLSGHYKIIYFLHNPYAYVTHVFDTRQDPQKKIR